MKTTNILSLILCTAALGACAAAGQKSQTASGDAPTLGVNGRNIEITGGVYDMNKQQRAPIISNDPSVKVFGLDGPVENPLTVERGNSVLDNTTAGGYTVFDDSVKVYPLPGDTVPGFVPSYAVPPLENQYGERKMAGTPTSLAASTLPPVPTVEVGTADPYANPPVSGRATRASLTDAERQPMALTDAEPNGLQPPSNVRPPMKSPFADEQGPAVSAEASGEHRAPMLITDRPLPQDDDVDAAPVEIPSHVTTPGRKSGPTLTGY